jgi:hypothetical protein
MPPKVCSTCWSNTFAKLRDRGLLRLDEGRVLRPMARPQCHVRGVSSGLDSPRTRSTAGPRQARRVIEGLAPIEARTRSSLVDG